MKLGLSTQDILSECEEVYTVWVKKSPLWFSEFFSQTLGNFWSFFTHLLYDHFYTRVQIFIQISPTL